MRVLWVCNIMLPGIAKKLGKEVNNKEGWISGLMDAVIRHNQTGESTSIQLGIAFPVEKGQHMLQDSLVVNQDYDIPFYGFRENVLEAEKYDFEIEKDMKRIIQHFKPDIVHCFGTEYPHTLAVIKAFAQPERTLVGLQGLCRVCAKGYMANLPRKVQKSVTFRDIVKRDTLLRQQEKFEERGQWELASVQGTGHVTGRTHFDKYWTTKWNPKVHYHSMNETLRKEFYTGMWDIQTCESHRIFFSQGDYPLKGMHYMLRALTLLADKYPDIEVYVAGNSLLRSKTLKGRLTISAYGRYLEKMIEKNHLESKVHFLGKLSADEMKEQYLKCHIFVCASSIENSPNSLGEAMLLGVPIVTADVGGILSLISEKEGTIFNGFNMNCSDDEKEYERISTELASAISKVFEERELSVNKAKMARERAKVVHDGIRNNQRLIEIYEEMIKTSN